MRKLIGMIRQHRAHAAVIVAVAILLLFTYVGIVIAQTERGGGGGASEPGGGGTSTRIPNFLGFEKIEDVVNAVFEKLLPLATVAVLVMVLWAAYILLFSAGNPKLVERAKQTLLWTVVGYAIILLGGGLGYILKEILTVPVPPQGTSLYLFYS